MAGIVSNLEEYGIFGNKKSHEVMHVFLRDQVARSDRERQQQGLPLLTNAELGASLKRSAATISRFRSQNRALGEASTLGREDVANLGNEIRRVILSNPKLSYLQIQNLLKDLGFDGVTFGAISYWKRALIDEGKVRSSKRFSGSNAVDSLRLPTLAEEVETILRPIFQEMIDMGDKMVVVDLWIRYPSLRIVGKKSLARIVRSMIDPKPEYKFDRSRKNKRVPKV